MSETKTIYRISLPNDGRSIWYDREGFFAPLTPEVAAVPMENDPFRVHLAGDWLSAVSDPELLKLWFPDTLQQLLDLGFVQQSFIAKHWHELPNEIVFDRTTAVEIMQ